ncbi:TetR/AcrR family transcriptional regulator [Microbacterium sp. 3J1]|uniref:TetR/AcrR family transcriptional regulator n=1 Tax=Microbacterium sp. 3J1 TaxID=861269 RepID=UPI000AD3D6B6|nr:TetR/AcrR family transcriptional regulator [Microbacterium sp. 3J1]
MPKIIDHDQRRRDIVEVARSIILKGGFEAATMRSIAAEAGFANGALKHYFPGKESIVAATFETVLSEHDTWLQESIAEGQSAETALRTLLEGTLPSRVQEIPSGRVLLALWEYAMSNDALTALYRTHLERWRGMLVERMQAASDAGAIRAQDFDVVANEYISVAVGATVINLMYPDGERLADYRAYVDQFLARLR